MEIGKPKRIYRVEPLRDPVPSKQPPESPEQPVKRDPSVVPAK